MLKYASRPKVESMRVSFFVDWFGCKASPLAGNIPTRSECNIESRVASKKDLRSSAFSYLRSSVVWSIRLEDGHILLSAYVVSGKQNMKKKGFAKAK